MTVSTLFCHIMNNRYNSDLVAITCAIPEAFDLGQLFFLICIKDLHKSIQECKLHHFFDDKNLFYASKSVKNLNNIVNSIMRYLNNWWSTNKTSGNVSISQKKYFLMK